jgi:hypothetical protein
MITIRTGRVALAVASLVVAHAAQGGLLDSPPPRFGSVDGKIVFRLGPIHFQPGRTDTIITCTNVSDAAARVAVEVFDEGDDLVGNGADTGVPAAGGNVTFVTSTGASRANAVLITGLAPIDHGKARVSSTTDQLACSAYHQMRDADGTVQEQPVELIKKVAQPAGR